MIVRITCFTTARAPIHTHSRRVWLWPNQGDIVFCCWWDKRHRLVAWLWICQQDRWDNGEDTCFWIPFEGLLGKSKGDYHIWMWDLKSEIWPVGCTDDYSLHSQLSICLQQRQNRATQQYADDTSLCSEAKTQITEYFVWTWPPKTTFKRSLCHVSVHNQAVWFVTSTWSSTSSQLICHMFRCNMLMSPALPSRWRSIEAVYTVLSCAFKMILGQQKCNVKHAVKQGRLLY